MLVKFTCAVVTRILFILVSLIGVWRVTWVKNNNLYWFLTILYLPLAAEMILTLKRRKGKDYKWWVDRYDFLQIFFRRIDCVGSWRSNVLKCHHVELVWNTLCVRFTYSRMKWLFFSRFSPAILFFLISIIPTIWILELHHQHNKSNDTKVILHIHEERAHKSSFVCFTLCLLGTQQNNDLISIFLSCLNYFC